MDDDEREYCHRCDGEGEIENGDPHYPEVIVCPECNGTGWAKWQIFGRYGEN